MSDHFEIDDSSISEQNRKARDGVDEDFAALTSKLRRRNIAFLPTTLREALDCFEQDEVVKEALGKDYAAYYDSVKREEWRQYHQSISQWEREQYLKTF